VGIRALGRAEFCKLVDVEVEALNALRRRDQVPKPNFHLMLGARGVFESRERANEYNGYGALALIIALKLASQYEISRDYASEIAELALGVIDERWKDISLTSKQIADGLTPSANIMFALLEYPLFKMRGRMEVSSVVCGNATEIAAKNPMAMSFIGVSLSQCAAVLRQRARRYEIDVGDFWAA
jgi:hypothetical protein